MEVRAAVDTPDCHIDLPLLLFQEAAMWNPYVNVVTFNCFYFLFLFLIIQVALPNEMSPFVYLFI